MQDSRRLAVFAGALAVRVAGRRSRGEAGDADAPCAEGMGPGGAILESRPDP